MQGLLYWKPGYIFISYQQLRSSENGRKFDYFDYKPPSFNGILAIY